MLEKELNHDLVALFKSAGWAYKIPDPSQESAISSSKRPFDGIAYFKDLGSFYFESKLDKHKLQAFSLSRVEDHQYENLLQLREMGALTAVILGFWIPRKDYYFFVFDPLFLSKLKETRKSILGKELQWYKDNDYVIPTRWKQPFTPSFLLEKRIDFLPEEKV